MNEQQVRAGVKDRSIPSTVANTAATSSVGTTKDKNKNRHAFVPTGRQSNKTFHMPSGTIKEATDVDKLHHNIRQPAKDIHIVLGIECDSLLSIPQFTNASYIAIFDKDKINIYKANNTKVTVSCSTILCGWQCKDKNLWRVPLLTNVLNNNTYTVLCNQPSTEFSPERLLPTEAIHNVYQLKMQPKLVRYHHVAARFPTKPTWLKAIKSKQFVSWPCLMDNTVNKHYLKLEETHKGHGRKACI
jgi:hypothetical protein